jgi:hypothetical protein
MFVTKRNTTNTLSLATVCQQGLGSVAMTEWALLSCLSYPHRRAAHCQVQCMPRSSEPCMPKDTVGIQAGRPAEIAEIGKRSKLGSGLVLATKPIKAVRRASLLAKILRDQNQRTDIGK